MLRFTLFLVLIACSIAQAQEPASHVRIAIYDDTGASRSREDVIKRLIDVPEFRIDRLKATDIRAGKLKGYDILIQPGGSGGEQGKTLGEDGREQIRSFVRDGGGYVGICAGAYLATNDYSWSLHILNAKVIDKKHWARGVGEVELSLTAEARKRLKHPNERFEIHYHQGPLLAPGDDDKLGKFEPWGIFESEIAKNGAPEGVMIGTAAIASGRFGKGRVLCFSPHPELTPGLEKMLPAAMFWVVEK